ncbi:WD repeat protein [Ceratobasidium sp. AG-Ba]|nr:WD repeat protein [Ceratobasidium sp. AG-Ba]QRW04757.1 WD repeat protein [Ceratobasidium sp. AG-Ba]
MAEKTTVTFAKEPLSAEPISLLRNPERQTSNPSKRKQTLLALLSELTELKDEETLERETKEPGPVSADATQDVNSREGIKTFREFEKTAQSLDRQLQEFANAVRQLGSSVGLMNATYHLRGALIQIEHFFRENAAELFTEIRRGNMVLGRINKQTEDCEANDTNSTRKQRRVLDKDRIHTGMRPQVKPIGDPEQLPMEMKILSRETETFVDRLNDIPEFTDELVNAVFTSFATDLLYRASCLEEFRGQLKTIAVQRYINDLTVDIGMHMGAMRDALGSFIYVGVPTIRHAQRHTAEGLQYLSTVATFFSGVTATTIQYSFDQVGNARADLVNALWIISLIFSIASAINSQLAYHWRAAMYRSPRNYVPWWVTIWIKRSPLFFLIGSVIAFSIGLCVFTYSSGQSPVVSALVTAFTVVTSSGLICVGLWFASERWTFSRTRGQRWLWDLLNDFQARCHKYLGITWLIQRWPRDIKERLMRWLRVRIHDIQLALWSIYGRCSRRKIGEPTDEEKDHASDYPGAVYPRPDPRSDFDAGSVTETIMSGPGSPTRTSEQRMLPPPSASVASFSTHAGGSVTGQRNGSPSIVQALLRATPGSVLAQTPEVDERPKPIRLKLLVERIIAMNRLENGAAVAARARAESDLVSGRRDSNDNYSATTYAHKARIRELQPGLENLKITQFLNDHMALVKHMQFSPNGDYLATCSWDRTAIIWEINDSHVKMHLKLYHPVATGGFVNQVAWSADGTNLLTRTQKGLKIWDATNGKGLKLISRPRPIQSAMWMPKGKGILSVEYKLQRRSGGDVQMVTDSCLVLLDSNGVTVDTHTLPRIQIWDAAVMADGSRVVAVGTLLKSVDNLQPTKSRAEKRLLVYNMKTQELEHHVPLLQDVRNVTLSRMTLKSTYALVSYENNAPPQMWRIDMKKGVKSGGMPVARLILIHSYLTKNPVDFAGQSFFGGLNDTFVCCSSKNGEIFIWDRTSATLLHTLRPEDSEVIRNFTCNQKASPGLLLVTGALDGALRIWSSGVSSALGTPNREMTSSPELQPIEGSSTPRRGASAGTSIQLG